MPALSATDATLDAILRATERVVVDFWAPWCAPCRQVSPVIDAMAQDEPRATFLKVNADENPQVTRRYGVMAMPAILYFVRGELVAEMRTGVSASVLRRRVAQWLAQN